MSTPIYYIKDGNLSFADKVIFEELEIYLYSGDKICLIGRNGCGKSSLMKVISGDYELDGGELFIDPSIKVGFLKQEIVEKSIRTIYEYVLSGLNADEQKYLADIILEKLGINGNLIMQNLSGGQLRRASLARSLVQSPDILLLDEPTNHLDITAIEWLEEYIKLYPGTVICVSHDRAFLSSVTNKLWWMDRGILRKSDQGFQHFEKWQEQILAHEEAALRKLDKKLAEEKIWLSQGVTARRKRNQKRLANLRSLRSQLQKHEQHLIAAKQKMNIRLAEEERKSKFIIEAEDVSFTYNNKQIVKDFNIRVKKGEKIGLIGPNGSGKSTLIKLLIGQLKPDTGKIKLGSTVDVTYFDQHREELKPELNLWQTLCPTGGDRVFLPDRDLHVAAYLKQFMFDPKLLHAKVSTLSGGEKNRLLLAKTLINPGNFLVLDEPTNDLDMDSLELLLELLADYSGTLLIISHDRDFLDRLVTRTLVFTNEQKVIDYIGGYEDYLKFYRNIGEPETIKKPLVTKQVIEKSKASNKLSYKYQRLLDTLPDELTNTEQKVAAIEQRLNDSNLYSTNPNLFNQLTLELSKLRQELENKLEQWLQIEEMVKNLEKS